MLLDLIQVGFKENPRLMDLSRLSTFQSHLKLMCEIVHLELSKDFKFQRLMRFLKFYREEWLKMDVKVSTIVASRL